MTLSAIIGTGSQLESEALTSNCMLQRTPPGTQSPRELIHRMAGRPTIELKQAAQRVVRVTPWVQSSWTKR